MNAINSTETLGDRLRRIRKEQGYPLKKVAEAAEISVAYLSKLELNDGNPTFDVLNKIAKFYNLTVEGLTVGVEIGEASSPAMNEHLEAFITNNQDKYAELNDPDWQRMLNSIRLRGTYPKSDEDWLAIFFSLRATLERTKR
jgi:transcriptional regulator with XRE-family HTH domain